MKRPAYKFAYKIVSWLSDLTGGASWLVGRKIALAAVILGFSTPAAVAQNDSIVAENTPVDDTFMVTCYETATEFAPMEIKGRLRDSNGEPIVGASVLMKNTSRGVVTDSEGNFTIYAARGETLVFSCIGYETREIEVGTNPKIDIELPEALIQISCYIMAAPPKQIRKTRNKKSAE